MPDIKLPIPNNSMPTTAIYRILNLVRSSPTIGFATTSAIK